MARMTGAGFAQRSVTSAGSPTAFLPETYTEPVEGVDPEDVRLGPRGGGRAAEPEGADGTGSGRNGDKGSRDALGDTTTGQTGRRVQGPASPSDVAGIVASLTGKTR